MTTQEARQILSLYRPGTADAEDAEMAEAMDVMRQDAELGQWFAERCKAQIILQRRFQEITVPAGLKEQIISEHRASQARKRNRITAMTALAGACVLLVSALWAFKPAPDGKSMTAFGRRMAKEVRNSNYPMDVETNDVATIRAYLANKQSPSDYALPKAIESFAHVGCAVKRWQNQNVSMICFRTGRPLPPGEKTDLFLFVVDRRAVSDPPRSSKPEFAQQNRMAIATWAEGEKLYLLAVNGDQSLLKQYF